MIVPEKRGSCTSRSTSVPLTIQASPLSLVTIDCHLGLASFLIFRLAFYLSPFCSTRKAQLSTIVTGRADVEMEEEGSIDLGWVRHRLRRLQIHTFETGTASSSAASRLNRWCQTMSVVKRWPTLDFLARFRRPPPKKQPCTLQITFVQLKRKL